MLTRGRCNSSHAAFAQVRTWGTKLWIDFADVEVHSNTLVCADVC
jgi:hypothetical protein